MKMTQATFLICLCLFVCLAGNVISGSVSERSGCKCIWDTACPRGYRSSGGCVRGERGVRFAIRDTWCCPI